MSRFPFRSLIAVALSVMTYSLLQREWGLAILMGVISLLLFILLVLVSRQRQDRGEGSITPFILSIGKAVSVYLFLFVFVGLGFAYITRLDSLAGASRKSAPYNTPGRLEYAAQQVQDRVNKALSSGGN